MNRLPERPGEAPRIPRFAATLRDGRGRGLHQAWLDRGLIPLVLGNRLQVAPPLNVSDDDAETGLVILDEALGEADAFLA